MPDKNSARGLITPINIIAALIVISGLYLIACRMVGGLGSVTNFSDDYPWGIWKSFFIFSVVPIGAAGFTTGAAVYLFGMEKYHSVVRLAVLIGFLSYVCAAGSLTLLDVGRPERILMAYPFIVQQGTTSLLFEVALCVLLYITVLAIEFCPFALEALGFRRTQQWFMKLTLGLAIFAVVLSTMHQSTLGAMWVITPAKLHPLWHSSYLPVFFFVSSIFSGFSVVIIVTTLCKHFFSHIAGKTYLEEDEGVILAFGKAACVAMAGYLAIQVFGLSTSHKWHYLFSSSYGYWFILEVVGFVAIPCYLFAMGCREKNTKLIRWTAVYTLIGILLNRFNVSLLCYNYHLPWAEKYYPTWKEVWILITVVTIMSLVFRFIVKRVPILYTHPDYKH